MNSEKKIFIALSLYLTALIASNTLGIKLMPFLFGSHLSAAIFVFPIVFLMTDVIGEVFGKEMSKRFVKMGFLCLLFFLTINIIANLMPSSADFYQKDAFDQIFGLSFRFTLASLLAFIIGEYQDVFSFFFFKAHLGGKFFWLRSNLSNLWGQLIDSAIWAGIAFAGIYSFKTILFIIIPWWLFKVGAGIIYTPFSYLAIRWFKSGQKADVSKQN